MFCAEHNSPRFYAKYQNYATAFDLEGNFIKGSISPNQTKFIIVWADIYKKELLKNWELAMLNQQPFKIDT